jgi:hypothetical protein
MIFSRIEQAADDSPVLAETPRRPLEREDVADKTIIGSEPAPPISLKRKRTDDDFEDVRKFRRVRIYTSLSTEAVSTMLATNVYVKVSAERMSTTDISRGYCYMLRNEDEVSYLHMRSASWLFTEDVQEPFFQVMTDGSPNILVRSTATEVMCKTSQKFRGNLLPIGPFGRSSISISELH